jgi:hypothetical protein
MAFVLIQHLDPSHESMLTEIIAKTTCHRYFKYPQVHRLKNPQF